MTVVIDISGLYPVTDTTTTWVEVIGAINGVNTVFSAFEDIGTNEKDFAVSLNGQILNYDSDYIFTAPKTITFSVAPILGDYIKVIRF